MEVPRRDRGAHHRHVPLHDVRRADEGYAVSENGGGGGGAGGAILVEAHDVVIAGEIAVNGGGGGVGGFAAMLDGAPATTTNYGGGGGGVGRIRINTRTGAATVTGSVSPSLGAMPTTSTQGRPVIQ